MKKYLVAVLSILCVLALGCGPIKLLNNTPTPAPPPTTFIESVDEVGWSTILIRESIKYDDAYNEVLDVIAKHYEMDMISKEGGYGRSNWIITQRRPYDNTTITTTYKTRVMFKFSADRTKVDIKTEAQFNNGMDNIWRIGYDGELLRTIKQDIEGTIGRTVK